MKINKYTINISILLVTYLLGIILAFFSKEVDDEVPLYAMAIFLLYAVLFYMGYSNSDRDNNWYKSSRIVNYGIVILITLATYYIFYDESLETGLAVVFILFPIWVILSLFSVTFISIGDLKNRGNVISEFKDSSKKIKYNKSWFVLNLILFGTLYFLLGGIVFQNHYFYIFLIAIISYLITRLIIFLENAVK